jgi:hypothetical protein
MPLGIMALSITALSRTALSITPLRGRIFSCVQPFYEQAVSNLDRSMHRSLWVQGTHRSFIEGSHMTKNTPSATQKIYSLFLWIATFQKMFYNNRNIQAHKKDWVYLLHKSFMKSTPDCETWLHA